MARARRSSGALAVVALVAVAATAVEARDAGTGVLAPVAAACKGDDDCTLISRTAGGCPEAVTKTEGARVRAEQEKVCAGGKGPREICGPMPGCIHWAGHPTAACEGGRCVVGKPPAAPPRPPSPCLRRRGVQQAICSGVPPEPNRPTTTTVVACVGCLADADCKAKPKGRCERTGSGGSCEPAAAFVCRYPGDDCSKKCPYCNNDGQGHALCERVPRSRPPSAPPR